MLILVCVCVCVGICVRVLQTVRYILCEWGSIFLMTSANEVWELKEKDVETKLQELFKKNLYGLAITLANTSEYDSANICDIYRMYGDHLYAKGDYDSAAKQYVWVWAWPACVHEH